MAIIILVILYRRRSKSPQKEYSLGVESGPSTPPSVQYSSFTLRDHFTLLKNVKLTDKVLGSGFFSIVYLGTWQGDGVAVKIIKDSTQFKETIQETKLVEKLDHPNITK